MSETPKTTSVTLTKVVPFRYSGGTADELVIRIERIPPSATSELIKLQIWWGLVPSTIADDDQVELHLVAIDITTPPDIGGVRAMADWSTVQSWLVSAGGYAVQTIEHEIVPFVGTEVNNRGLANRTRDFAWSFMMLETGAPQVTIIGTLTVFHTLFDRTWGSDAYTWNSDPDDVNRDGVSGIDMGWY